MNAKKLIQPIRVPMEVVLCAGILALHAEPARAGAPRFFRRGNRF